MAGEDLLLRQTIFAAYNPPESDLSLAGLALDLTRHQEASWPEFAAARAAIHAVRTRAVHCNGFSVRLQYNPRRMVSSAAEVDAVSIRQRPCFLCLGNLPVPQRGILYRTQFLVLCNPAPIFAHHYTISHVDHTPQLIDCHLATLLALAKDFGSCFSVFYNGPKCGASAPDHLHFQASSARTIPIETDVEDPARRILARTIDGVSLFTIRNLGRGVILLEGSDRDAVKQWIRRCTAAIRQVIGALEEPMLNMLCSYVGDFWRVVIFPRRQHRPAVYFRAGPEKTLVSPATVDVGGMIITPVEKDFLTLDARLIEEIFRDVCVSEVTTQQIMERL